MDIIQGTLKPMELPLTSPETLPATPSQLEVLERVQERVLWLATSIVHHANRVRTNESGIKVGGHQASSASLVSIMTALYFLYMRGDDKVSVKPHAAPVLHAINYLLGRLDRKYLTTLRAYHGLQSYPSRSKDPDPVDFSTGSVGIGATATLWNSLAHRYLSDHFDITDSGRRIALVGDAELDEGAIWEALNDPMVAALGNVLWIIDVNRQSLDRIVPNVSVERLQSMFTALGWNTIQVKYGRYLRDLFTRPGGKTLRLRLDKMHNGEYQRLLRSSPAELRDQLAGQDSGRRAIHQLLRDLNDTELTLAVRDLGGHDLGDLLQAFSQADGVTDRPTVVFAYTIKAWRLPTEGHPGNHSSTLSVQQWEALASDLHADSCDPWAAFSADTPEARMCQEAAARLTQPELHLSKRPVVPKDLGRSHNHMSSTQQALGRILVDITHVAPDVASHIVTLSPDVASSTNLGGWINRTGIWSVVKAVDWFSDDKDTLVRWSESENGQHIELGIAEQNLVGLLAELGTTWSRSGQPLFPIGTLYDPFVSRALEPWSFGIYSGGQSILIGTPSGVTLAPEGGAHQSIITPSIGLEQPGCVAWEPAFGQDLEWSLLYALENLARSNGISAYFRLNTRPIDQSLAVVPTGSELREKRRKDVLAGGYVLRRSPSYPAVILVGMGSVMPEVIEASGELLSAGVEADVVCLTSADLVFRALQARQGLGDGQEDILGILFPSDRKAPIVTVLDGHPHTLAFLAAIHGTPIACLGVSDFGQVGDISDLYRHFGIDVDTIVGTAIDMVELAHGIQNGLRND